MEKKNMTSKQILDKAISKISARILYFMCVKKIEI